MSHFKSLKALGIYTKVGNEKIKARYKQKIPKIENVHLSPEISRAARCLLLGEHPEIKDLSDKELFNYIHFDKLPPKEVKISTKIIYHNGRKTKQIIKVIDGVTSIYIE